MRLFHNKTRCRKRSSFLNTAFSKAVLNLPIVLPLLLLFIVFGVEGEITSFSGSASSRASLVSSSSASLGAYFLLIYSAFPQFVLAKSIRNGKEVEEEFSNSSTSLPEATISPTIFASRSLQVEDDNDTSAVSDELDLDSVGDSSQVTMIKEYRNSRRGRQRNRLSRQMGLAQEIALIAPALQTMGCIPKFFCGMNSKPPTEGTTALNDLAYLIKFAMMDDDDVPFDESIFPENTGNNKPPNNRGKDGLQGKRKPVRKKSGTKMKDDLIIENMAEEEMIQEDPANLPFVWKDMQTRITSQTGHKERLDDDILDAIIVQPEQSSFSSIFTGIKSVFRIGRSVDLEKMDNSSQVSPRSSRSSRNAGNTNRQGWRRRWKRPFWRTPQFRQDMELAQRIGKTEQDDTKCSSTFNVCPYTVHEMMAIVHGGYKKRNKNKKNQEWYINAQGPPQSSEEEELKDPQNLLTTTTEKPKKTEWKPTDPESQIYYMLFPNKAVEKGITTVPTTRRPTTTSTDYSEGDLKVHRRPHPTGIQHHVEYENDDESSKEPKPEHIDVFINGKKVKNPWRAGQKMPPKLQPPPNHRLQRPRPTVFIQEISEGGPFGRPPQKPNGDSGGSESGEDDTGSSEEKSSQLNDSPVIHIEQQDFQQPHQNVQTPVPHQQSSPKPIQQQFGSPTPQAGRPTIAPPRPKYKLVRKKQKNPKPTKAPKTPVAPGSTHPHPPEKTEDDNDENEASEEDEEDEEDSRENSSEEAKDQDSPQPPPPGMAPNNNAHHPANNAPPRTNMMHGGRPSEEVHEPPPPQQPINQQYNDEPDNSDEEQNSNSGPVEVSNEDDLISMEMAKIPKPARPPPHFRPNGSNEYFDGMGPHPPHRPPINFAQLNERPHGHNNGPPGAQNTGPQTTTQKYSTGLLNYFFGKKKDQSKLRPESLEKRPRPPQQRNSPEDDGDDNEEDDDNQDDDSDEDDNNEAQQTPQQNEGDQKRPSHITPNFQAGDRPQRPYRGSTSMEDSDEKRIRQTLHQNTQSLQQVVQQSLTPMKQDLPGLGEIIYIGKPHRIIDIPAPATPPSRNSIVITSTTTPTSTTKKTKDSDEEDAESEEEKQSEESKEDNNASKESKESSEETGGNKQVQKITIKPNTVAQQQNQHNSGIPPQVANFHSQSGVSQPPQRIPPSNTANVKTRAESDDSTQDDSGEDAKNSKEAASDEGSDEASSEEDTEKNKKTPPPPPKRKPEDDELDNRPPPIKLPSFGGDVTQIGDILGDPVQTHDDEDDEQDLDEDIPAPPPLVQGFATSLEIQVPTNAPPIKIPANYPQQQQAPSQPGGNQGSREPPSEQLQGVRNPPGSSSSNRGPSANRGQQQRPNEGEGGDKKKENSSEEKSSEENNKKEKSSEESEEGDFIKGVITGFDNDGVVVGSDDQDEDENEDQREKHPPQPPPVYTGTQSQKLQILAAQQSFNGPRPVPPGKPQFSRPPLRPHGFKNELLQQQQQQNPMIRPGENPQQRPPFSVSNLLRPLLGRPMYKRKPLDPKVVEWIKESYGIPDINNPDDHSNHRPPHLQQPNRSGLGSTDTKEASTAENASEKDDKEPDEKTTTPSHKKSTKNKSSEKVASKTSSTEESSSKNDSLEKLLSRNKSSEKASIGNKSFEKHSTSDKSAEKLPSKTKLGEKVSIWVTSVENSSTKNKATEKVTSTNNKSIEKVAFIKNKSTEKTTLTQNKSVEKITSIKNKSTEKPSRNKSTEKISTKNKSTEKLPTRNKSTEKISTTTIKTPSSKVKASAKPKPSKDYVTQDDEAKLAQSLFGSSEEEEEEDEGEDNSSSEEDYATLKPSRPTQSSKSKNKSVERKTTHSNKPKPKETKKAKPTVSRHSSSTERRKPQSVTKSKGKLPTQSSPERKKSSSSTENRKSTKDVRKPGSSERRKSSSHSDAKTKPKILTPRPIKSPFSSKIAQLKSKLTSSRNVVSRRASFSNLPPIYGKHRYATG